ncbi:MAG: HAD-IA family hydrolase [Desulfatiglans sp.]|jgi:phosphoglycolate phosphatase|nr:HAD-IA family hydrolase [Desulfatiglans sp.]
MYTVIFDLDGTLSDSAEGIIRSINYALPKLGYDEQKREDLLQYIGPPLNITFERLTGIKDKEFLLKAVNIFRERYFTTGFKENVLYDGIRDVLKLLVNQGNILCIATSKRKDIAENVLRHFEIFEYFTQVHGSDIYRKKADLLMDMLNDPLLNNRPMIMIGDRDTDFIAAKEAGMPSIAVRWGYGNDDEFRLATAVVERPSDLPEAIMQNAQMVKIMQSTRER